MGWGEGQGCIEDIFADTAEHFVWLIPSQVGVYFLGRGTNKGLHTNISVFWSVFSLNQSSGSVTFWYRSGALSPYTGLRIRILLFLAVAFKIPKKKFSQISFYLFELFLSKITCNRKVKNIEIMVYLNCGSVFFLFANPGFLVI